MTRKKGRGGWLTALFFCGGLGMPLMASARKTAAATPFSLPAWLPVAGIAAGILLVAVVLIWQYLGHKKRDESREKRQRAREGEQESAEMRSLLCSARHELAFFYMNCKEGAAEALEQVGDGAYLEHTLPVEHERYYIYPVCASNIGKIRDAGLGRHILLAYTKQIRFIETLKWNNNLLRWLREARKRYQEYRDEDSLESQKTLEENLREHLPKMTAAFDEMEGATQTILDYINEDGTVNPRSRHKRHSRYAFLNTPQSVRYK